MLMVDVWNGYSINLFYVKYTVHDVMNTDFVQYNIQIQMMIESISDISISAHMNRHMNRH
jgi:hypothetical protein